MKNLALLALLLVALGSCKKKDVANSPATPPNDSIYTYYTNAITGQFSSAFTPDGNVIVPTKPYISPRMRSNDILLYKISQSGGMLWNKLIALPDTGFYGPPSFESIAATTDGGYLLCGDVFKREPYAGSFIYSTDVALLKLDVSGNVLWLKTFGGGDEDHGQIMVQLRDGNYLVAGQSTSFYGNLYSDIYLIKVNANGDEIWSKAYDLYDQQSIAEVWETAQGNIMVYANDLYGTGNSEAMLLAADANGNELWHKDVATGNIGASCATEDRNGDIIAVYNKNADPHIMRISPTGNVIWDKSGYLPEYGYIFGQGIFDIKTNKDNTFTLTGLQRRWTDTFSKCLVMKIDGNGDKIYSRVLPGMYDNYGMNLLKADNGNNIITGNRSRDSTIADVFFIKTNDY